MIRRTKERVFNIFEQTRPDDFVTKIFGLCLVLLICFNVIAMIMESVVWLSAKYLSYFYAFEVFSIAIFTVEYGLRIWSCTASSRYRNPLTGRLAFILTPFALLDLFVIVPFYFPMIIAFDGRVIRLLRLFRLFRIFKVSKYSKSLKTLTTVLNSRKEDLEMSFVIIALLLVLSSTLMYHAEYVPNAKHFQSIPASMWWAVGHLTTVGSEVRPITPIGKFLSAIIALLGIGLFALPSGILASGFSEEIQKRKSAAAHCPHCGKNLAALPHQPLEELPIIPEPVMELD